MVIVRERDDPVNADAECKRMHPRLLDTPLSRGMTASYLEGCHLSA